MAKQTEVQIGRRLGRVEMLKLDLQQLPEGYQPGEVEIEKFAALVEQIGQVYQLRPGQEQSALEAAQQEIEFLKAQVTSLELDLALARGLAQAQVPENQPKTANDKSKTEK